MKSKNLAMWCLVLITLTPFTANANLLEKLQCKYLNYQTNKNLILPSDKNQYKEVDLIGNIPPYSKPKQVIKKKRRRNKH